MCACMGFTSRAFYYQLIVLPFHCAFCYFFIYVLDWGAVGAAFSGTLSSFIHMMAMIHMASSIEGVRQAWFYPTSEISKTAVDSLKKNKAFYCV